ncbi:hypothetical protein MPTK1_2g21930 [Marchantia polymorpha subsp. ruderalis]
MLSDLLIYLLVFDILIFDCNCARENAQPIYWRFILTNRASSFELFVQTCGLVRRIMYSNLTNRISFCSSDLFTIWGEHHLSSSSGFRGPEVSRTVSHWNANIVELFLRLVNSQLLETLFLHRVARPPLLVNHRARLRICLA